MAWGLEIDAETVRLCWARLRRGRLRVGRRGGVPVPAGLVRPSLKESNLADRAALGALVRELCGRLGCRGWVRLALPDPVFSLRTIVTDDLPPEREEARRFLRWQARDLLPFPADEARLDYLGPVPGPDGRMRVPCLLARARVLQEYETLLDEAGLRASVVDARSVAMAQAASARLGSETVGLLAVGAARTTLLVIEDRRPRFWRVLSAGDGEWMGSARLPLLREVGDSIAFCRESEGTGPLQALFLDGQADTTTEIAVPLAEWLEVPVRALDPGGDARWHDGPDGDPGPWGAALGVAIRPC